MTVRLPESLAPVPDAAERFAWAEQEERTVEGLHLCGADLSDTCYEGLRLRSVLFENCRLTGCRWERADLGNVVFRRCELSNSGWRDAFWERTVFEDCKAVGAGFAETGWRQAAFAACALAYATFDRARLREVAFSDCDLSHAAFHECTWKRLSLDKTRLREASFLHTPLAGLDLTGCELDGLVVSDTNAELRGAIVTAEQAAMLAKRLGLVIKE